MSFTQDVLKFTTLALSGILIYFTCDKALTKIRAIEYEAQESALTTSINGQQTQRLSRRVMNVKIELNTHTQPAPVSVNVNSE